MKTRCGFTLLELMMVVIIIGILASIALPQYLRAAERARAAEALTVLAAIRSSELRFRAQDANGAYVINLANLDIDVPGVGANPPSLNWTFNNLGAAVPGTNATATRTGGQFATNQIQIDLDGGGTCATNAVWGLTTAAC